MDADEWFKDVVAVIALPGMKARYKDAEGGPPDNCLGFPLVMVFYANADPLILEIDNHGTFHKPKSSDGFIEFIGAGMS